MNGRAVTFLFVPPQDDSIRYDSSSIGYDKKAAALQQSWMEKAPPLSQPMDNRNRYPPGTSTLLRIQQMEQVNEERGGEKGRKSELKEEERRMACALS